MSFGDLFQAAGTAATVGVSIAGMQLAKKSAEKQAAAANEVGIANQKTAQYQEAVARNNAEISRQSADLLTKEGEVAVGAQINRARAVVGSQRAAQAASGVDINKGSPSQVRDSTANLAQIDAALLNYNVMKQVWGMNLKADEFEAEAGLMKLQGDNALRAGRMGAQTSLIGGRAAVADKWAGLAKNFPGGTYSFSSKPIFGPSASSGE